MGWQTTDAPRERVIGSAEIERWSRYGKLEIVVIFYICFE